MELILIPNDRRDGYIDYLNSVYKNGSYKMRADPNNGGNQFVETNKRINKQLQQRRRALFGWQSKFVNWEKRFTTKMPVHHQRQQKIIGNKIGWEIDSNQEYYWEEFEADRGRVLSRTLYIGFWHDKFIENVCIDIETLYNEASAFGRVLKLNTYPNEAPYECAFIVFESRAMAEKARTGLSLEFNDLFIQHIAWAQPPDCAADPSEKFNFYEGSSGVLRMRPLTSSQSQLLVSGFVRRFNDDHSFMPFDVSQICVSYFSEWKDLRISFVDDVTGNIDTTKYQIKAVFAKHSINEIAKAIENDIYRNIVSTEYDRLLASCQKLSWDSKEQRDEFIKGKMMGKFVKFEPEINWNEPKFDKIRWCGWFIHKPFVHVWLKFKQMKKIYLRKPYGSYDKFGLLKEEMYKNEDDERWVEVSLEAKYLKINEIDSFDIDTDCLVIERCKVQNDDWAHPHYYVICTWPREQGDDWKETLQVGDIVKADFYEYGSRYTEAVVTYVYPKDHKTMSGKCVIKNMSGGRECIRAIQRSIYKRYNLRRERRNRRRGREYKKCYVEENAKSDCCLGDVAKTPNEEYDTMSSPAAECQMYECSKYSKNHKAKKLYPQKKKLRKKMKKYGVKSGAKRIENKMKKYKNRYEYLAC